MAKPDTLTIEQALHRADEFLQAGEPRDAIPVYGSIIETDPENPDALFGMGRSIIMLGDPAAAVHMLRAAISFRPEFAAAHNALGVALMGGDDLTAAEASFRHALELDPKDFSILNNLATLLNRTGDYAGAEKMFRKCLDAGPDNPDVEYNLGLLMLLQGRYAEGWPLYAKRWEARAIPLNAREFTVPKWAGEDLGGRRILVHAEQGLGDAIQFVRFLPAVAERGGRVILECPPPLVELLDGVAGADQVVAAGETPPQSDVHAPLMDLPGILEVDVDDVSAPAPYLTAAPERIAAWRDRIRRKVRYRVGLVWAGNPTHRADRLRSVPLSCFAPLFEMTDIEFVSLQVGAGAEQLSEVPSASGVEPMFPEILPFPEVAAAVSSLDLLISVDTALAHLAGALGVPVWVLVAHVPDWRWLLEREDSPWYPTLRLFRQSSPGEWDPVIEKLALALAEFADD